MKSIIKALKNHLGDHGMTLVAERSPDQIIIEASFAADRYQDADRFKDVRGKWFSITDNGGELSVWRINGSREAHPDFRSIAYVSYKFRVNIETILYRLRCHFEQKEIDYDYREQDYLDHAEAMKG